MISLVCFLSSIPRNQANTRFSVLKLKHPLRKRALIKNIVVFDTNSLEQFADGSEVGEFT